MSSIIPFSFGPHQVRVVTDDNGEPLFVAKDVATALGYDNTTQAVRAHCKHAKSLKDIGSCSTAPQPNQPLALDPQTKMIPESDLYRLTLKSKLDSAERFQDWVTEEVLPSIRKTGSYQAKAAPQPRPSSQLRDKLAIARAAASMLRMSETSKAAMLAKIAASENIAPAFLPAYVDETLTRAITPMLKELGHDLGHHVAAVVNPALAEMGILEKLERTGSKGDIKTFWSLTEEGLEYGRNETSPNNPRQTTPLFYVNRFEGLLRKLESHLGAQAICAKLQKGAQQ